MPIANTLLRLDENAPCKKMTRDPHTGTLMIESAGQRCWVHVPFGVTSSSTPSPVLVALHGAGKNRYWSLERQAASWAELANAHGCIILYPEARGMTWDFIQSKRTARGDVDFLSSCLNTVRQSYSVSRVGIHGISDGGSMALSLAAHNPSTFEAAMSVSAGFCAEPPKVDARGTLPVLFMLHGSQDGMFPLERVGLPLKARLQALGYTCDFRVARGQGHVPHGWQDELLSAWLGGERAGQSTVAKPAAAATQRWRSHLLAPEIAAAVMRRL